MKNWIILIAPFFFTDITTIKEESLSHKSEPKAILVSDTIQISDSSADTATLPETSSTDNLETSSTSGAKYTKKPNIVETRWADLENAGNKILNGATTVADKENTLFLPGPKVVSLPKDNPLLPWEMQFFEPELDLSLAPQAIAPQIAEWTRSAKPGETIAISGWQILNHIDSSQDQDVHFNFFGQTESGNNVLAEGTIQSLSGNTAVVTLPDTLPADSAYLFWIFNDNGISHAERINMAEVWWVGPKKVAIGDTFWIFGRNLLLSDRSNAWVYLQPSDGKGRWLTTTSNSNPYRLEVKIPDDLNAGLYEIWTHNGGGGIYGWSNPLDLVVDKGFSWSESTYNVKAFGAAGNGITDDTYAIKSALDVANADPWSTVYFPAGTYIISSEVDIGNQIRLLGDGSDLSILRAIDNFDDRFMINYIGDEIEMLQLGIESNALNKRYMQAAVFARGHSDLKFVNCRWDTRGTAPGDLHKCRRVLFQNLESIQSTKFFMGNSGQIFFENCQFYGFGGHCNGLLAGFGVHELSISGCTADNYGTLVGDSNPDAPIEPAHFYKGRFFYDQPHWGNSRHHYFGESRFNNACPALFLNHKWRVWDAAKNASNGSALYAWGNMGNKYSESEFKKSPRAKYSVYFARTGTHYVWIRGRGTLLNGMASFKVGESDSCHIGLNDEMPTGAARIDGVSDADDPDAFVWRSLAVDETRRAMLFIPTPGYYDLDLYVFEDGFLCDKILLTTNSSYTPKNAGPSETFTENTFVQQNDINGLLVIEAENTNKLKDGARGFFTIEQNSGEQIMWESNGYVEAGGVLSSVDNHSIILSGDFSDKNDYTLTIVDGKGIGQSRAISSAKIITEGESIQTLVRVDEPWNVVPDTNSKIVLMRAIQRAAVYSNLFDGSERCWAGDSHIASAGVQAYKGGTEVVVVGNVFQELRNAINLWVNDPYGDKPITSWLCTENYFNKVRRGIRFNMETDNLQYNPLFANVFNRNIFDAAHSTKSSILSFKQLTQSFSDYPADLLIFEDALIFEHNDVTNTAEFFDNN